MIPPEARNSPAGVAISIFAVQIYHEPALGPNRLRGGGPGGECDKKRLFVRDRTPAGGRLACPIVATKWRVSIA